MRRPLPSRGEVWFADLGETRGHEQAGRRPALVVSDDRLNHGPPGLTIIVPLTGRDRGVPAHVRIGAGEGGLRADSFAKCEEIRSVSRERLLKKVGAVSRDTMAEVESVLRILLAL